MGKPVVRMGKARCPHGQSPLSAWAKPVVRMGKARCPHGQSPLSAWVYLSAPLQNL
jgi:hypothetical protein